MDQRTADPGLFGPDRCDRPQRPDLALGDRDLAQRARAGTGERRAAQGGQGPRAARRHSGADQGQYRDQGAADHRGQPCARGQPHQPRRAGGRAAAGARRGDPRQDQSERMGEHSLEQLDERVERGRRAGPEPLCARSLGLRLVERIGRGGGGEPGGGGGGHRDRRVGGLPLGDEWAGRAEADPGAGQPHLSCRSATARTRRGRWGAA